MKKYSKNFENTCLIDAFKSLAYSKYLVLVKSKNEYINKCLNIYGSFSTIYNKLLLNHIMKLLTNKIFLKEDDFFHRIVYTNIGIRFMIFYYKALKMEV